MLDAGLMKLVNLKILVVRNNFVRNLEAFLLKMNLEILDLEGNPLENKFEILLEKDNHRAPKL